MKKDKNQIQKEAGIAIDDLQCSGIEVGTGVGKTRIGLKDMVINYTDYAKYLVAAPTSKIQVSWLEQILDTKCGYLKDQIEFTTYRSLPKQSLNYDIVYLDECHSLKESHRDWLTKFKEQGGRIVGLTGTYPIYMKSEKGRLCNDFCPKVYTYKVDQAVEDNILNDYEIIVHKLRLSDKKTIPKTGKHGDFMTSEKKDYQYWSNLIDNGTGTANLQRLRLQRMKLLQGFETKMAYAKAITSKEKRKALIFVNTKAQADKMCKATIYSGKKGTEELLEDFKYGKVLKIAAIDQLSEGVNIPGLKVGYITHSYANNKKAAQKIGRFLRLNPKDKCTVHILCYEDTVDKDWVTSALKEFNQDKISWITPALHAGIDY